MADEKTSKQENSGKNSRYICDVCGFNNGPECPDCCPVCGASKNSFREEADKKS